MTAGAERSPGALLRFACVGAAAGGTLLWFPSHFCPVFRYGDLLWRLLSGFVRFTWGVLGTLFFGGWLAAFYLASRGEGGPLRRVGVAGVPAPDLPEHVQPDDRSVLVNDG